MPYRQKETINWWISYTDASGKRIRCSAGTTDFAEARALEQKLRSQSFSSRKVGAGAVFDSVLAEYLGPRLTSRTRSTARHLAERFRGYAVADITRTALHGYVTDRQTAGAAPGTINKELVMLSAAINTYNLKHGTAMPNHASHAKLSEPHGIVRWITKDEAQRLIDSASPLVGDFVRIGLYTGLRAEALTSLRWADVDFERAVIMVSQKATPRAKPRARSIPIHPICRSALLSCRMRCADSSFVFCQGDGHILSVKKGFAGACRRAGIQNFRIHDLRHTFASWLVMAGRPLLEVKDLPGHSSIKQTERYAHLAPENLRAAMEAI